MKRVYKKPIVEILQVKVEKGFAISTEVKPWEQGGDDSGSAV